MWHLSECFTCHSCFKQDKNNNFFHRVVYELEESNHPLGFPFKSPFSDNSVITIQTWATKQTSPQRTITFLCLRFTLTTGEWDGPGVGSLLCGSWMAALPTKLQPSPLLSGEFYYRMQVSTLTLVNLPWVSNLNDRTSGILYAVDHSGKWK